MGARCASSSRSAEILTNFSLDPGLFHERLGSGNSGSDRAYFTHLGVRLSLYWKNGEG